MTGLRLLAPVALAAVLTVAAVSWWLTGSNEAVEQPRVVAATASPMEQVGEDNHAEGLPALEPDEGLRAEDVWAHLSDPTNSDLPPEVFVATSQIAADVVRADATGEGRDRWPDYWGGEVKARTRACCTSVEIHASGIDGDAADDRRVRALVIWSGWNGEEQIFHEAAAVVVLARHGEGWIPVRPQ